MLVYVRISVLTLCLLLITSGMSLMKLYGRLLYNINDRLKFLFKGTFTIFVSPSHLLNLVILFWNIKLIGGLLVNRPLKKGLPAIEWRNILET